MTTAMCMKKMRMAQPFRDLLCPGEVRQGNSITTPNVWQKSEDQPSRNSKILQKLFWKALRFGLKVKKSTVSDITP